MASSKVSIQDPDTWFFDTSVLTLPLNKGATYFPSSLWQFSQTCSQFYEAALSLHFPVGHQSLPSSQPPEKRQLGRLLHCTGCHRGSVERARERVRRASSRPPAKHRLQEEHRVSLLQCSAQHALVLQRLLPLSLGTGQRGTGRQFL